MEIVARKERTDAFHRVTRILLAKEIKVVLASRCSVLACVSLRIESIKDTRLY